MATKAVYLETKSFMGLLRKFIARRGPPANIYSDNGKTYVGTKSELDKFLKTNAQNLKDIALEHQIKWYFIPAYSPNFGVLWEACVKSVKYHLKQVLINTSLTCKQFTTLIIEIEGILISRPFTPLSSEPDNLPALTSAHFLIGQTVTSIPEADVRQVAPNRLVNIPFK